MWEVAGGHLKAKGAVISGSPDGHKRRLRSAADRGRALSRTLPITRPVGDMVITVSSGIAALYSYPAEWHTTPVRQVSLILGITLAFMLICERLGCYRSEWLGLKRRALANLRMYAFALPAASALIFFAADLFPGWLVSWSLTAMSGLLLWTYVSALLIGELTALGYHTNRVAIVCDGDAEYADGVARKLTDLNPEIDVTTVFNLTSAAGTDAKIDDLLTAIRSGELDCVVLGMPLSACDRISAILERLTAVSINVDLPLDGISTDGARHTRWHIPMLRVTKRPLSPLQFAIKVLEDKLLAAALLLFTGPLMLAIALAVRLSSPGHILFRQERTGFNNEKFTILKFRTIYSSCEDLYAKRPATRNDPRVTPIGKVLRKYSLDELPQLINVLKGEMSIVGPRPHPCFLEVANRPCDAVRGYPARHRVRPGITGWAQVNDWRGGMDTLEKLERRLEYDLAYVENWSLWFDFKILARTVFTVARPHDAY